MIFFLKKYIYLSFLFIMACGLIAGCQEKPALTGFDQVAWRQDVRSCNNIRPKLISALNKVTPQLIGLRHNTIIEILGKPEGNSLEKSGQRVYYYFVEAGPQCSNKTNFKESKKLFLRFDALDRVNKIILDE